MIVLLSLVFGAITDSSRLVFYAKVNNIFYVIDSEYFQAVKKGETWMCEITKPVGKIVYVIPKYILLHFYEYNKSIVSYHGGKICIVEQKHTKTVKKDQDWFCEILYLLPKKEIVVPIELSKTEKQNKEDFENSVDRLKQLNNNKFIIKELKK